MGSGGFRYLGSITPPPHSFCDDFIVLLGLRDWSNGRGGGGGHVKGGGAEKVLAMLKGGGGGGHNKFWGSF